MNDKAMKKYNALIEDLVSLAKESHDSRESIVCTAAAGLPNDSRQTPNSMGENRATRTRPNLPREQAFPFRPVSRFNSGFAHQRRGCRT